MGVPRTLARRLALAAPATAFVQKGKLFKKEVLRAGWFQQPVVPWDEPLDLTNDDIESIVEESNRYLSNGNRSTFPEDHGAKPSENYGYVKEFFCGPSSEDPALLSAYALIDVRDPEIAAAIVDGRIAEVSVELFDCGDGMGNDYGMHIRAVAFCNQPIVGGQGDFIALAARRDKKKPATLAYLGASTMAKHLLSGIPARLSMGEAKPRLPITSAVRKAAKACGIDLGDRSVIGPNRLEALCDAAVEKLNAPVALGVESARKALARTADATFAELQTEKTRSIAAEVDAAILAGRVPAAAKDTLTALLSVRHGFSLSAKGEAADADVRDLVTKLVAAIPEGACVPLDPSKLSIAPGAPPAKPKAWTKEEADADVKARSNKLSIVKSA